MKRFFAALLFIISFGTHAQSVQLSPSAHISVITCGPWQGELYSAFGHSAFRVYDSLQNIDEVYNYGVFDFNQPNFYLNFARGYLYYQLGVHDYQRFQDYYIYHNRYVHEQVLNLTPWQNQKLYNFLQWNALPENEHYRYDYFYDNCATRIRDVVVKVLGDSVTFNGSYIKTNYTIRDLTDIYLQQQPWGDLGIDICLGLPMDKQATPFEYMFLPDYIESGFDHASITLGDVKKPIVKRKNIIYSSREEEADPDRLPHPIYIFTGLAIIAVILSLIDMRRKKLSGWFDVLLFTATGSIGVLLFFLWFATDHRAAAYNLNVLWALPSHLIIVFVLIRKPAWLKNYFLVTSVLSVLLLLSWTFLPQKLNLALIPVVFTLGLRAFMQYYIRLFNEVKPATR